MLTYLKQEQLVITMNRRNGHTPPQRLPLLNYGQIYQAGRAKLGRPSSPARLQFRIPIISTRPQNTPCEPYEDE